MRTIHRIKPRSRRRAAPPGPGFPGCVGSAGPGNDTSLDYRERTISRTEAAISVSQFISRNGEHPRGLTVLAGPKSTARGVER
jgi:hypothetical protein